MIDADVPMRKGLINGHFLNLILERFEFYFRTISNSQFRIVLIWIDSNIGTTQFRQSALTPNFTLDTKPLGQFVARDNANELRFT